MTNLINDHNNNDNSNVCHIIEVTSIDLDISQPVFDYTIRYPSLYISNT